MINRILNNMTFKGKLMVFIASVFFILYALSGTGLMITALNLLNKLTVGTQFDLMPWVWGLFGLVLVKTICNLIADVSKHFAGFNIMEKLRSRIINCLKSFSLGFYTNERLGEISTVIHKDVDNMEKVVAHLWPRMIADFAVAAILGTFLFIINWQLGFLMISLTPVAILSLVFGIRSGSRQQKETSDRQNDMVSLFIEYVKGIPLIKAFSESDKFKKRLENSSREFGNASKQASKSVAGYISRFSFFIDMSYALLAGFGAWFLFKTELTLIEYLMFIIISKEFYKPFLQLRTHWMNYISVKDSYSRIARVLDAPKLNSPLNPKQINGYDIQFDNCSFQYSEGEFKLQNADFHLKNNTLTALVGPSGSGKTTITNLLLRFWDTDSGSIRIGGTNIQEVEYDELLSKVSIVMQNVILFSDTIFNNIKMGNRNATRREVMDAAKKAMIHDFIMTLPNGYDTILGENGAGLSGGQKQRLSIARALIKDSPIVILDEITSNVDPVNEVKIQSAISNLAANRTVIVIAHHLRTVQNADQIIVFDKGQITEKGTHNELLKKQGLYAELWEAQERSRTWTLSEKIPEPEPV